MKHKDDLYQTLACILENPNMTLFHSSLESVNSLHQTVLDHPEQFKHNLGGSIPNVNQMRHNNKFYNVTEQIFDMFVVQHSKKKDQFKEKSSLLRVAIDAISAHILNTNEKKKYVKILQEFFSYQNAKYFLHDFIHALINTGSKTDYKFKLTRVSINLAETLILFILNQNSKLKSIFSCFDYHLELGLSDKERNHIVNLVKALFNDSDTVGAFLREYNIIDENLQKYICDFLRDIFIKEYSKNRIYIEEVKTLIKSSNILSSETDNNNVEEHHLKLGAFIWDMLVDQHVFSFQDLLSQDQNKTKNIKNKSTKILVPKQDLIADNQLHTIKQKPFLTEKQLFANIKKEKEDNIYDYSELIANNISKLIHDNPRITLELLTTSYMHKNKLYTKLSINKHFLALFLLRLHSGLPENDLLYIYNIDVNLINRLCVTDRPTYVPQIMDIIKSAATRFNEMLTATQLKKKVDDKINELYLEASLKEKTLLNKDDKDKQLLHMKMAKQHLEDSKELIYDIINKLCHRKQQFVSLICDAIDYSVFKYFINTTYIDSRGRAYLAATALNILTNPLAKLFVSLYDPNEGEKPSVKDILTIKDNFHFEQTRNKMKILSTKDEIDQGLIKEIYKYICSYLSNISVEILTTYIHGDKDGTLLNTDIILSFIRENIIKPKKLYYVYSLIFYEQLRYINQHDKIFCNYVQKDASSSGFQVMAAFFCDAELAEMSNLKGTNNYNIYMKATTHCYTMFSEFNAFSKKSIKWFDAYHLEDPNWPHLLNLISFTQQFKIYLENKSLAPTYFLTAFFQMDLTSSSVTHDLVKKMEDIILTNPQGKESLDINCEHLLPYLPLSYRNSIDTFANLTLFKNSKKILEYLFCIRYALRLQIIAEKILWLQNIPFEQSLWNDRELTKSHVMTTLYRSTPYGRREAYMTYLQDKYIINKTELFFVQEFASFLERCTSAFLSQLTNIQKFYDFADELSNDKVIIKNRNFKITIDPKITRDFQVSCSSYTNKRGPQLVIKKITNQLNTTKLKTMLLANIAHSLDSDIMHHFVEICLEANKSLKDINSLFRLAWERNHDCFILNYAPLLEIFVEEAYLRFCNQNNMRYIEGISDHMVKKYQKLSVEEFMALLNPINPNFIK